MSLVSTEWLENNIKNVKIFDCSWHLPSSNRNGLREYSKEHIPNSIFFDLDKHSNQSTDLPHMMPTKLEWEKLMSSLGISNDDRIIVYDNSDLLSSCRLWYSFIYFGHRKELVSILDGGFKKWKHENKLTTDDTVKLETSKYLSLENLNLIKNKKQIQDNLVENTFKIIDARNKERFEGKVPEPRKGLRSGSIPNSFCIPFRKLINKNNTFKNVEEMKNIFKDTLGNKYSEKIVFSCGSGVTACVLALAYSLIHNNYKPTIYDGSWAEYGKILE